MKKIICASIIALGLALLGFFIQLGMSSFNKAQRTVSVRGLSEKEVMANKVTWPVYFKEIGNDLPLLYKSIKSKNEAIVSFLKERGIEQAEIFVGAPQLIDVKANNLYSSEESKQRYVITSVITVNTKKVDKVRKMMEEQSELLKQGIALSSGDYQYETIYEYTDFNELKPKMVEQATANAKETAEKFAINSNSRLGKIKKASQGLFTIENRDPNTPYIKKIRVVTSIEYYLSR